MTLGVRLLLLVLIAAVPVVALEIYDQLDERSNRRAAVAADSLNAAELLAERLTQLVETARSLALATAQLAEVQTLDGAACSARMRSLAEQFPVLSGIGAVNAEGVRFCGSAPVEEPVSLADRPYFQEAVAEKRFTASGYLLGRTVGRPSMVFAAPALDEARAVRAVVIVAVDLERLSRELGRALPSETTAAVIDEAGTLIARVPPAEDFLGRPLRDSRLVAAIEAVPRGTVVATGVDGVERVYGFAPVVGPGGFRMLYGASLAPTMAAIDTRFWRQMVILAAIFTLAATAALLGGDWTIRRPLASVQALARRLAQGDLSARADLDRRAIGEIGSLAASLHAMAGALEEQRAALRASEQRITDIAANFPGIIFRRVMHRDRRIEYPYMSQGVDELLGLSAEAASGISSLEAIARFSTPDKLREWWDAAETSARELIPLDIEAPLVRPDGRTVWIRSVSRPHRRADGATVWDGIVLDITEPRRIIEALRSSEEFNRRVLESSRDCIKVLDLDGRLISINECGRQALEAADAAAIIGAAYVELWHGEDRAAAEAALRDAADGGSGRFVGFYRTPSGRATWWDEVTTPILGSGGAPERILVVSRDITERKQAEERQLLLMAELDHRVKNTLAAVQSMAYQTLEPAESREAFIERIAAIAKAHTLLSHSRWEGTGLATLLQTTLEAYSERIALDGPDLQLDAKTTQALAMAFHELATNAAKYGALSAARGRITISWHVAGEGPPRLVIAWSERGGPKTEPPSRKGWGSRFLERSLCYTLDAAVRLDYRRAGLSCVIEIPLTEPALPVTSRDAADPAAPLGQHGAAPALAGKRVLLVEDSVLLAMHIETALTEAGCVLVGPVPRLAEALDLAAREPLDAAVLDVNLEGELVFPVAERLRARSVPYVFMTGYDGPSIFPVEFRAEPRLGKPVHDRELLAALAQAIARAAAPPDHQASAAGD